MRKAVDRMKEYENRSMPQGLAMMLARDEAAMQKAADFIKPSGI